MVRFLNNRIPPPIVGLITLLFVWVIARIIPAYHIQFTGQNIIAAILLICGLSIDLVSLGAFRKARTTFNPLAPEKAKTLVMDGFYKFSRNPVYLGMLLILIAWVVYLENIAGVVGLICFVLYMNRFQIMPEEKAMIKNFGDQYRAYMYRVRRWI